MDNLWPLLEARERPMHVGGLQLFDLPHDRPPSFVRDRVEAAREYGNVRPPFNRRLARPRGLAGIHHWVEADVDLDYHVSHLALPHPGRVRELLALVSQLHAGLLDRHRPLWEVFLIEGLADDRLAMYSKIHHSMLDGVAAMRQLLRSLSEDPDRTDLPPPWAAPPGASAPGPADEQPSHPLRALQRVLPMVTEGAVGMFGVYRAVAGQLARAQRDAAEVLPYQAPPSMLNQPLTGARRFVAQSYELERIRAVADAVDGTINDVVMAMSASALRAYLISQGALPDRALISLVPVSFREQTGGETGNAVGLVPANLGTHLADPRERLTLIRSSMQRAKARIRDFTPAQMLSYSLLLVAPMALEQLTHTAGPVRPPYNVVISNLPGPPRPLYWNGIRMTGLYPLSLLVEGFTMNITQTSYAGSMEFGITADRRALPSVQRMIDHLEDGLAELEQLAGV